MIVGKLKITIKINELPQPKNIENSWQQFNIDCDGHIISVTVKPKFWKDVAEMSNYKSPSVYTLQLGQVFKHKLKVQLHQYLLKQKSLLQGNVLYIEVLQSLTLPFKQSSVNMEV